MTQPGEEYAARVDARSSDHARPSVPSDQEGRSCMGRRHVSQGAVGCCPRRSGSCGDRQARSARPAAHLRPSLPSRRRRTGSDPVPARPRLHPGNRTLPRMQAEAPDCRKRPIGNRTRCRLTRTTARADASIRAARLLRTNELRGLASTLNSHQYCDTTALDGCHHLRSGERPSLIVGRSVRISTVAFATNSFALSGSACSIQPSRIADRLSRGRTKAVGERSNAIHALQYHRRLERY